MRISIRVDETIVKEVSIGGQRGFIVMPIRPEAPAQLVRHCE